LELQATFAARDKETAIQALAVLQKQYDHLSSEQSHWDDLRHASEQIQTLTTLIGQVDNEEIKELRRVRDHSKMLEGEHVALQKRFMDQQSKAANSERAAVAARQNLMQAQQRASEWETRAREFQGRLELAQTELEQAEQIHAQLDADHSLAKLQLEEAEANERLMKVRDPQVLLIQLKLTKSLQDREAKLHEQVVSLEAKITRLQAEAQIPAPSPVFAYQRVNGNGYPRPDSQTSSGMSRSGTPIAKVNGRTSSPSSLRSVSSTEASVWDSMHAPSSSGIRLSGTVSSTKASVRNSMHASPRTSRSGTPVAKANERTLSRSSLRSVSSTKPSVCDSIHAPSHTSSMHNMYAPTPSQYPSLRPMQTTPRARRAQYSRPAVPSPTPSTVSLTPTEGADGWWS
jgi:hypothetical protein